MTGRRKFWRRSRGPILGPPVPPCGARRSMPALTCDLPPGHSGKHGAIVGYSRRTGGLVESTSVTRELWGVSQ